MKLEIDYTKNGVSIGAFDEGVRIAHGGAKTSKEAAQWLVRHINRKAANVEELLIDLGVLTSEEIDEINVEGDPP